MNETFANNTIVKGRVRHVTSIGLLLKLDGGQVGVVREREISWDANVRNTWREHYKPGQLVEAMVIGAGSDDDNHLNLSIRLAQSDPWVDVLARFGTGQWVDGVVTGTTRHGVFVELAPGIEGLLRESELPEWFKLPYADWFWYGDQVRVMVKEIHASQRKLNLSMRAIRDVRWRRHDATGVDSGQTSFDPISANAPSSVQPVQSRSAQAHTPTRLPLELAMLSRTYSVLVVDDDDVLRETLHQFLSNTGQRVLMAATAEDGLEILANDAIDLVLMDVHLPGMDGIAAAAQVRKRFPDVKVALMTDWAAAEQMNGRIERAQTAGARLISKPFPPDSVLPLLLEVDGNKTESSAKSDIANEPSATLQPSQAIVEMLTRARRLMKASAVILFALDPAERKFHVIAHAANKGADALHNEAMLQLIYSPVRDVAEDRQFVRIEDTHEAEAKLRYLKPLLKFGACIGLPLAAELTTSHALFMFFDAPMQFSQSQIELARAAALNTSAALEKRELLARTATIQRKALLGDLSWGLVHELNQRITPASQGITLLQKQLEDAVAKVSLSPDRATDSLHAAERMLAHVSTAVTAMAKTTETFKQLTVQSQESIIRVDTEVQAAAELAQDMANRCGVALHVEMPRHMFVTRGHATRIQHVLLNIIVNAVQQLSLLRPVRRGFGGAGASGNSGRVEIRLEARRHQRGEVVLISIEDDGPGIHRRHHDKIFGLGFTTRPNEGSGLGLFIARQIMQGMDGYISIAESAMLWGTRFVVELPMVMM